MLTYYIIDIVIPLYSFNFIGIYLFMFMFVFMFVFVFIDGFLSVVAIVDAIDVLFIGIFSI